MKLVDDKNRDEYNRIYKDLVLWIIMMAAFAVRIYLASIPTYLWDEAMLSIPLSQSISLQWGSIDLPIMGDQHPALPGYFIRAGSILLGSNPVGF